LGFQGPPVLHHKSTSFTMPNQLGTGRFLMLLTLLMVSLCASSPPPCDSTSGTDSCLENSRSILQRKTHDSSVDELGGNTTDQLEESGQTPSCGFDSVFDSVLRDAVASPSAWMQSLAKGPCGESFKRKKMTEITVPGSHDAAAYAGAVSDWSNCDAIGIRETCSKWFITHTKNVKEQLEAGSRYLDLRARWKAGGACKWPKYTKECWVTWHPPPASTVATIEIGGLDFQSLTEVIPQLVSFLTENPKEIVIVNLKLQQFKANTLGSSLNAEKTKKRLELLDSYLSETISPFIANPKGVSSKWWLKPIGDLMSSGKSLMLQVRGDDMNEVKDNTRMLSTFVFEKCKTRGCGGPVFSAGFANKCCDADEVRDHSAEKRNKFALDIVSASNPEDRPLLRVSDQFTYQPSSLILGDDANSLLHADRVLKPTQLDLYNKLVTACPKDTGGTCSVFGCDSSRRAHCDSKKCKCGKDSCAVNGKCVPWKKWPGSSLPAANIVGMDFINTCSEAAVTIAVCGSLLPFGQTCNAEVVCPTPNCTCTGYKWGTVGHNKYECTDGSVGWCASDQICYATEPFKKDSLGDGCRLPPFVCYRDTGGTCKWFGCKSWRNAYCDSGRCKCREGSCAVNGKCVANARY